MSLLLNLVYVLKICCVIDESKAIGLRKADAFSSKVTTLLR
jgi:hypothetical protein